MDGFFYCIHYISIYLKQLWVHTCYFKGCAFSSWYGWASSELFYIQRSLLTLIWQPLIGVFSPRAFTLYTWHQCSLTVWTFPGEGLKTETLIQWDKWSTVCRTSEALIHTNEDTLKHTGHIHAHTFQQRHELYKQFSHRRPIVSYSRAEDCLIFSVCKRKKSQYEDMTSCISLIAQFITHTNLWWQQGRKIS